MIFHEFTLGDSDDPELYAAQPLWEWQQTEQGCWVLEHCLNPNYRIAPDPTTFGYKVTVYGNLSHKDATYYTLKYK